MIVLPLGDVPVLETPRLRMRRHELRDLPDCVATWAHPDVVRYIGGKPLSEQETWAKMLRLVGHWTLRGFGYWVVEEKGTGDYVGEVGFGDFKRDIQPSFHDVPELGWVLHPRAHGKGYATEAGLAACAWGDARFPPRTVCIIDVGNAASVRVAEKLGFVEQTRTNFMGDPCILLQRVRPT